MVHLVTAGAETEADPVMLDILKRLDLIAERLDRIATLLERPQTHTVNNAVRYEWSEEVEASLLEAMRSTRDG